MENKVYDIVNEKIIEQLEAGTAPWRMPWKIKETGMPKNFVSDKQYRGVNVFLLMMASMAQGFDSPYWMTMKQANDKGGKVKKGEKSTLVVFWKMYNTGRFEEQKNGGQREISLPVLRYYTLFNAQQTEGVEFPIVKDEKQIDFEPIAEAERIAQGYYVKGPRIDHGGNRACYIPTEDRIQLPEKNNFSSSGEYYSTLFHEMTHSTGHERRLRREGITDRHFFGDAVYSKEELIAEMGAAFLCGVSGIENTLENSAAYLANWLKVLKANKTWLVCAASAAQKAADYIQGIESEKAI